MSYRRQFLYNLRNDVVNLIVIGNFKISAGGEHVGSEFLVIRGVEKGLLKIRVFRSSLAK